MGKMAKTLMFWAVVTVSAFLLWQVVRNNSTEQAIPEISYSDFLTRIANGQVSRVVIAGAVVRGTGSKGERFRVIGPSSQSPMLEALQGKGVEIWIRESSEQGWPSWILNLAPLVLLAALWLFMIRTMQKNARLRTAGQDSTASGGPSVPKIGP